MKVQSSLFAILSLLMISSHGTRAAVSTSTTLVCETYSSTVSGYVISTTTTKTYTCTATATVTSTPVTTKTPPPITTTTTTTKTSVVTKTGTPVSDTFTVTSTITEITFVPTTSTVTKTTSVTTTTVSSGTTTVPTPPGFKPVQSTLPRSAPKKRSRIMRAVVEGAAVDRRADAAYTPTKYPSKVVCTKYIEVITTSTITKTASSTSTVTAPKTKLTSTATTTTISTSTIASPHVSTTKTEYGTTLETRTTTVTQTTTVTTTSTVSVFKPTATAYAICQDPNNYANNVFAEAIAGVSNADGSMPGQSSVPATSATDCCNSCQLASSNCGAFFYQQSAGTCVLIHPPNNGVCAVPNTYNLAAVIAIGSGPNGNTIGNGVCADYSAVRDG